MWIKEPDQDVLQRSSNATNLNFLWKAEDIPLYVMDNHLAAAWCWMQECNPNERYNFFHIDRHNDLGTVAPYSCYQHLKENPRVPLDEYLAIRNPDNTENSWPAFTWDNYINQTIQLFPDWFGKCNYATHKQLDDRERRMNLGCNVIENTTPFHLVPFLYSELVIDEDRRWYYEVRNEKPHNWIVNLDLDYFYCNLGDGVKRILTDEYIRKVAYVFKRNIKQIKVITVATSPECCGGWNNSLETTLVFLRNESFIENCIQFLDNKTLYPNGWHT